MPIEFRCTLCNKLLRTKDDTAGKQAKCPDCGTVLMIPAASSAGAGAAMPSSNFGGAPGMPAPAAPAYDPFKVAAPQANPFQAPLAEGSPVADEQEMAGRGSRFVGAFVDNLCYGLCGGAIIAVGAATGMIDFANQLQIQGAFLLGMLPLAILQWYLITNSGQSIGKKAASTRILRYESGELPGFAKGVVLRGWVPGIIGVIPIVGGLFGLIDALWIFGAEKRCLHDLIAGTKVVKV